MSIELTNIPIYNSIILVLKGEVVAPLIGGQYEFIGRPLAMSPKEDLSKSALYIISEFSFAMDISVLDYQSAIINTPLINFYLTSEGRTPLVRKPIPSPLYYDNFSYIYSFMPKKEPTEILFSVKGLIDQTANLVGKAELTATVVLSLYEVVDDVYISNFKRMGKAGGIPSYDISKRGF